MVGTMAADQEQFFRILSTLLSSDNNVRSQAEVSTIRYSSGTSSANRRWLLSVINRQQRVQAPSTVMIHARSTFFQRKFAHMRPGQAQF